MSIVFTLLTPTNGQRQVSPTTSVSFSVVSDSPLVLETLNVALNGVPILEKGSVTPPTASINLVGSDGYSGSLLLKSSSPFLPKEKVSILDAYGFRLDTQVIESANTTLKISSKFDSANLIAADGYFYSVVSSNSAKVSNPNYFDPATNGFSPWVYITNSSGTITQQARVVDAYQDQLFFDRDLTLDIGFFIYNYPQVQSITRGYDVSQSFNLTNTVGAISIIPKEQLALNKLNYLTVEASDENGVYQRSVFSFRTLDTRPPELFNFPLTIRNSELSFQLVDFLQSPVNISSLDVYQNGTKIINQGILSSNYSGSVTQQEPYKVSVFLKPLDRYENNQLVKFDISTTDAYGNAIFYHREVTNKTQPLVFELQKAMPAPESVLDPRSHPLEFLFKVNESLTGRMINISYQVNQKIYNDIINGQIVSLCSTCQTQQTETGEIRLSDRELYIRLDNIQGIEYNSEVDLIIFFQEVNEEGEPIDHPFFVRTMHYTTVSSRLGPSIDNFKPSISASPTTTISFRLLSLIDKDPIDTNSITISIGDQLAIDQGAFVNEFFGAISSVQGSEGNAITVSIDSASPYQANESINVKVECKDVAGNYSTKTFTFKVLDDSIPSITFTPEPNIYNKIIRVNILADQPALIYYTTDGSVPEIGKVGTALRQAPVNDVPIFAEGLTQIKAFAVSQSGVRGPTITAIYDLNTQLPEVDILSPINNYSQDLSTISINYNVTLSRGFLTKVEVSTNGGPLSDTQNTLTASTILVTNLRSGTNVIKIYATDNYNNVGVGQVSVIVNPSSLYDLEVNYAPLSCPKFSDRAIKITDGTNDFIDTRTVVLVGYGHREEQLVSYALGQGKDGQPVDFNPANAPDSRHFSLSSYPLVDGALSIFVYRKGREILLSSSDYVLNSQTGQFVLDHPLETQEGLRVEYISQSDQLSPEIFYKPDDLYQKHGLPTINNPISLAAALAFENGAQRVLAIQPLSKDVDPTWSQAFLRLEKEEGYLLCPVVSDEDLSLFPFIRESALAHANKMSQVQYRKEKVVYSPLLNEENTFDSTRLRLFTPDLNRVARRLIAGELFTLNNTYLSAALAGKESSLQFPSTPLSKKTIQGFTFDNQRSKSPRLDLDQVVSSGVMPLLALSSGATIYQARTSTFSSTAALQEPSIIRSIDYISKNLRHTLETNFTGQDINNNLLRLIQSTAAQFVNSQADLIANPKVASIKVNSTDPRQVDILISYDPLYPLNELSVSFTVSTVL